MAVRSVSSTGQTSARHTFGSGWETIPSMSGCAINCWSVRAGTWKAYMPPSRRNTECPEYPCLAKAHNCAADPTAMPACSASRRHSPTKEQTMSPAARLAIEWAERGHIPDAVIRAASVACAGSACARSPRPTARAPRSSSSASWPQWTPPKLAPLPHLANEQHYEVPARILRPGARAAPQVQLRLVARGHHRPRAGRSRGARGDLRACRAVRRTSDTRTGLRLGIAHAVDGRALPGAAASRRCPIRIRSAHGYSARPNAAACQRRGRDRRHE